MSHYVVDRETVRRETRRDSAAEQEHAHQYGWYSYQVYKLVPISQIVPEVVWNPDRYERALAHMRAGDKLDPIYVSVHEGKYAIRELIYEISDGIHRYNASLTMGFTHIPVVYSVMVEVSSHVS